MTSDSYSNQDWNQIVNFITSSEIINICNDFLEKKAKEDQIGFNIFQIISDKYHREDFHSDFLALLLNPQEKHGAGNLFLNLFISMLEKAMNKYHGNDVHFAHYYPNSEVYREYPTNDGRIDILILSSPNKRAIVVENKMNGAPDMPKQLPRYYDFLSEKGIAVDAIVHLSLDGNKTISREGWSKEDEKHVNQVLVRIPAYNHTHMINLVDDFFNQAIPLSNSIDVVASLRQYSQIIKHLNQNNMDKSSMEKFYQELQKDNNLKIALSIRDMLNNFQTFFAQYIADKYNENGRCQPFPRVVFVPSYGGYALFERYEIHGLKLNINVNGNVDGYWIRLECQETRSSDGFKKFTEGLAVCKNNQDRLYKYKSTEENDPWSVWYKFDFDEEQELIYFLDNLLMELRDLSGHRE